MFPNFYGQPSYPGYYQPRPARRPVYNPYDPYGRQRAAAEEERERRAAAEYAQLLRREEAYRRAAEEEEAAAAYYRGMRRPARGFGFGGWPEEVHVPDTRIHPRQQQQQQRRGYLEEEEEEIPELETVNPLMARQSAHEIPVRIVREQSRERSRSPVRSAPTPAREPTPEPAPAPAPTFEDPTPEQLEAAEKISSFYLTSKSLSKIHSLRTRFLEHKEKFKLPSTIDYHHNGTVVSVSIPASPAPLTEEGSNAARLAYTKNNTPIHAYQEEMSRVLVELDSVDSRGEKKVREARRNVVREVEEEAAGLEASWRGVWEGHCKEIVMDKEQ